MTFANWNLTRHAQRPRTDPCKAWESRRHLATLVWWIKTGLAIFETGHLKNGMPWLWDILQLKSKDDRNKTPFYNVDIKAKKITKFLKKSYLYLVHQFKHLSPITLQDIMRGKGYLANKSKFYTALMNSWPWCKPLSHFMREGVLMNLAYYYLLLN